MLTVAEALNAILQEVHPTSPERVDLSLAGGRILREAVSSDVDIPPFDKALMDGYALRSADIAAGRGEFNVVEEILAGGVPRKVIHEGEAARIMTGAPIPAGADAVVIVERTTTKSATNGQVVVQIDSSAVVPEMNLLRRGVVARSGGIVVSAGKLLRAQEIGALAEAGCRAPSVSSLPRVAILATGDELVSPGVPLGPGQIRNSNEPMLAQQMADTGAIPQPLGIAPDREEPLLELIRRGLSSDLLLLSGGVSAGKKDLVPAQLDAAGVRQVFHKIRMKPGKPLWFGVYDSVESDGTPHRCLVFGLPGNPVSSMVCADLFVRPALRRFQGIEPAILPPIMASLSHPFLMQGDRPTYHPARMTFEGSQVRVEIVDWIGSSDLRSTVSANGTVFLPPGEKQFQQGDLLPFHSWGGNGLF